MAKKESWDSSENWYTQCVGEKGHYFHQAVVMPSLFQLLQLQKKQSLLDLGCGQGVLARHLPEGVEYWGVDLSKALIHSAKQLTKRPHTQFAVGDATAEIPFQKQDFDVVCLVLSLQNMENPQGAIALAARHLKVGGKLAIVLNHPCFRIPRQSSWGIDEAAKLQYRRVNTYLSPQKIPIQTNPGKGEQSAITYSYHYPLSAYSKWIHDAGMRISLIEEWCSDKKSEGSRARMEDRARKEIPIFLTFLSIK
jgi:ubiquinone/menaquinone biosynthesis C-methylase UbiE